MISSQLANRFLFSILFQPMILVGIAYSRAAEEKRGPLYKLNRTRDYTPTHVSTGGYGQWFQKPSGGADRFCDFLSKELVPYIEQELKPNDRAIIGYYYGGLFATYALLTRPGLFQRFVIVSPSLWWDRHVISKIEEKRAKASKDLPARAFFSVGGDETMAVGREETIGDLKAFVSKLRSRGYPGLEAHLRVASDETHHTVFPAAAMRGIRRVFRVFSGTPVLDPERPLEDDVRSWIKDRREKKLWWCLFLALAVAL